VHELERAARRVPPSSLRDVSGARPFVPRVAWGDVCGLDGAKAQLEELLVWPHEHGELLDELGVQMAQGVLLYGPPGTGKTLLAQAMASHSRLNFMSVQIPELVKGDVGGSEEAIAAVFAKAKEFAPTLLFLDELQAFFGAFAEIFFHLATTVRTVIFVPPAGHFFRELHFFAEGRLDGDFARGRVNGNGDITFTTHQPAVLCQKASPLKLLRQQGGHVLSRANPQQLHAGAHVIAATDNFSF